MALATPIAYLASLCQMACLLLGLIWSQQSCSGFRASRWSDVSLVALNLGLGAIAAQLALGAIKRSRDLPLPDLAPYHLLIIALAFGTQCWAWGRSQIQRR